MYALSELGRLSAGLLLAGVGGAVFMLIHLRACARAGLVPGLLDGLT